jgi:alpha-beta hydrolase superfamily lysophospholipase
MPWWGTLLIIVGALLVAGLIFSVFFTFLVAYIVYSKTLMRGKSGTWGREHCSEPGCIPLETMWNKGLEWKKGYESYIKELEIKSKDGLKLVAEWFDYGFDKTVIILPGRRETLVYSYFYANPYKESGVNVLVVDQRAHGFSEGKYSTGGIKEAEDVSLWMKYLHDELGQKEIILHGICVGTCCATITATKYRTDYLKAVILDSAFISYKEIYKNHYLESGHKLFPVFYEIWFWFRFFTHCSINDSKPEKYMPELNLPVLFLWGTNDVYCLPEKSKIVFAKCGSKNKQLEWFEGAEHSRVRLFDEKRYDGLVKDFLARNI